MIRTISPSAVAAFLSCPRLYQYSYIDKAGAWLGDSPASQKGRQLHLWLERHGQGRIEALPAGLGPDLEAMWAWYLEYLGTLPKGESRSEWAFHVPLQIGVEKILLTGRLDRLLLCADHWLVLDWKTGSLDGPADRYAVQMAFYAWALWQMRSFMGGEKVCYIETRVVSLKDRNDRRQRFEAEDLEAWGRRFESAIERMDPAKYSFLPDPRQENGFRFCQICQFQKICPEGNTCYKT